MKVILLALTAGALFGAGLALSGMVDPDRVRGFLDAFGRWDPTLGFVMAGAMVPMALAWRRQAKCDSPWLARAFDLPETISIDPKLALGAVIFGIGWGLAGLCPGPAIADLALRPVPAGLFVGAMLVGMVVHRTLRL